MTQSRESEHVCFDCKHPVSKHSGEYQGWDTRGATPPPAPQSGTGCLVAGCSCRRWFESVS